MFLSPPTRSTQPIVPLWVMDDDDDTEGVVGDDECSLMMSVITAMMAIFFSLTLVPGCVPLCC